MADIFNNVKIREIKNKLRDAGSFKVSISCLLVHALHQQDLHDGQLPVHCYLKGCYRLKITIIQWKIKYGKFFKWLPPPFPMDEVEQSS